ncbi:MAG: nitrogenase molybdenum-iron protein [Clostridiales bacterium]|nr:nitrogenase molybdenum-iron protein [Clostridiales bacterium]
MQTVIENPRNGCGMHGVLQTVQEIRGVVPIVHSNAGCAVSNYLANRASGSGNGYVSGYDIPGTNVQERHVIFGGASRLREQIKNTLKVADGRLYIVLNSCESAMVGDDVDAMTREAQEQHESVIDSLTAGFHGDSHFGYESVLVDIIRQLPTVRPVPEENIPNLVNVFGIVPQKDVCFKGNLEEIRRILEGIGVKANIFFGFEDGTEEFAKAPAASLNLVFSKWGIRAAKELEKLYKTQYLVFPYIPTGIREVRAFAEEILDKLALDPEPADRFLEEEERQFRYYLSGIAESFYRENAGRRIAIVGDESDVRRYSSYLSEYLGAVVTDAVITDDFPDGETTQNERAEALKDVAGQVCFSQDSAEIAKIIKNSEAQLILASSLEDEAAGRKGIPNLAVSYPVYGKAILTKSHAGIHGALTLTEDYMTKIKESSQARERELEAFLIS